MRDLSRPGDTGVVGGMQAADCGPGKSREIGEERGGSESVGERLLLR